MQLKTRIIALQDHLHELDTIKQIRLYLKVNQLRLVTTIFVAGFSCLGWDVTDYRVGGVLNLSIRVKISSMGEEEVCFENRGVFPVRIESADFIDQNDLFEKFKQGIKACIKEIH